MFSEPCTLGFDPTIVWRASEHDGAEYDILVQNDDGRCHMFRTLELLYDGSDQILGRGTRVWKTIRVDSGNPVGDPVALKDSWVDHHREREGGIDGRIRQSAIFLDNEDRERLERCLLTVVGHGDVHVDGSRDSTRPIPADRPLRRTSNILLHDDHSRIPPQPTLQTHYRIAFQEIGSPLRDEISLGDIFKALVDVCAGGLLRSRVL